MRPINLASLRSRAIFWLDVFRLRIRPATIELEGWNVCDTAVISLILLLSHRRAGALGGIESFEAAVDEYYDAVMDRVEPMRERRWVLVGTLPFHYVARRIAEDIGMPVKAVENLYDAVEAVVLGGRLRSFLQWAPRMATSVERVPCRF